MISKKIFLLLTALLSVGCGTCSGGNGLTLIPPASVSDKVDLDIRAGITNDSGRNKSYCVRLFLDGEEIHRTSLRVAGGEAACVKHRLETAGMSGVHEISLDVRRGNTTETISKQFEVIPSDIRSTKRIDGAYIGFYHWSDQEGKMWNPTIKTLTDGQWKEMIGSMNKLGMNIVIVQETWRNQHYVGKHSIEKDGYKGRAFYPSDLYDGRMPITAEDPLEAVLSQADEEGMNVFVGVGMYAWFDYTSGSLEWHKKVAKELWDKYSHHPSFYGFYVSEEGMGSLDCFEKNPDLKPVRQQEVLHFFEEFTSYCHSFAPDKPVMFSPNGWWVSKAKDLYPILLKNVDIITPFAFNRMPKGDFSGVEAVHFLQDCCDEAGAHLWLDLEAFLFDKDEKYLVPRPIEEIKGDLLMFDIFEKVVCYQYPGVFNDPSMSVCVGEPSTLELFRDYQDYLKSLSCLAGNTENVWVKAYYDRLHAEKGYKPFSENPEYDYTYMADYAVVSDDVSTRQDIPAPVGICCNGAPAVKVTSEDGTSSFSVKAANDTAYLYNLVPGVCYTYQLPGAEGKVMAEGRRRMLYLQGVRNARDLGGLVTEDGKNRVRYGRIYRTSQVDSISAEAADYMKNVLNVGLDLDLRYKSECGTFCGSPLGDDVGYARIEVKACDKLAGCKTYGMAFREMLSCLESGKSVFFHCVSGADRTGSLALLIEGLLGVSEGDCVADYELTSLSAGERWRYRNGTRSKPYDKANNFHGKMQLAMEHLYSFPGDSFQDRVTNFMMQTQGVTEEEIGRFRRIMLEP